MTVTNAEDEPRPGGEDDLLSLVRHEEWVPAAETVEGVFERFRGHAHEFVGVTEDGAFLGLVSRGHLGVLLGTRYGFTLHSRHPIRHHLLPAPLVVSRNQPLLEVLDAALGRTGEAFYQDLAVVGQDRRFLGIIPVPALVRAQSRLMQDKVHQVELQERELREHERMAALNEKRKTLETLVGGIAHELNNKLSPAMGYAELLGIKLSTSAPELGEHCRMILESVRESGKIIRQLRQLSRPASLECAQVDPAALVADTIALVRFRLNAAKVEVEVDVAPGDGIWADPAQIKQVLLNLVINAVDAMEHSATRTLRVTGASLGDRYGLAVADTGEGIPDQHLARVFDPFFTTKDVDKGTGLGLSVCQGIIKQHNGAIRIDSRPGAGTTVYLELPRGDGAVAAPEVRSAAALPRSAPPRSLEVLVVDDEEHITALARDALQALPGWSVARAHGGREAIAHLERHGVDLLVTDLRMPGLDGFGILDWVRRERPGLLRSTLVITGDAGSSVQDEVLASLPQPLLRKPFTATELQRACETLRPPPPPGSSWTPEGGPGDAKAGGTQFSSQSMAARVE